jgi:GT2 family glycosyltransferase
MKKNKVLISILNWNKAQETLACVKSLIPELAKTMAEVTVIIIDNGSKVDELSELEAGLPDQSFILKKLPTNLGFTGGHNVSIQIGIDEGYDFIWLLNNDSTVLPGALAALLETMQLEPKCGAASPVIRNADDESLIASCLRTHDWGIRSYRQATSIQEAERIQLESPEAVWLVGTAIFFRIQALKHVGLLDDRFFAYYDDDDIGVRLAKAGWYSRCAFSASVAHESKRAIGQYPLYFYYLMQRNELLFWQKHTPSKHRHLLWLKLVDKALFNVNRLYRSGLQAQGDAALLGTSDFIYGRFGRPDIVRRAPLLLRIACQISAIYNQKTLEPVINAAAP